MFALKEGWDVGRTLQYVCKYTLFFLLAVSPDKCYDKIGVALIFKGHSDEGHTCLPDKPAEEMEKAIRELRLVTVVVPKLQGESPLTAGLLIAYVMSTLKKVADFKQKYLLFTISGMASITGWTHIVQGITSTSRC